MGHPEMFIVDKQQDYSAVLNIITVFAEFAAGAWPQGWALVSISILCPHSDGMYVLEGRVRGIGWHSPRVAWHRRATAV